MAKAKLVLKSPKKKKAARTYNSGVVRLTTEALNIIDDLQERLSGDWTACQLASQIIINAANELIYDGDAPGSDPITGGDE